jgi:flagellar biosynthetic protein FliR
MNQVTLSHLIQAVGGGTQVTGFILVLARIAPLFLLAPLFSSTIIPTQVRTTIALGLAIGLTGVAMHGQHIPTDPLSVAGLLVVQVLVGIAFAFALAALLAGVQFAGGLVDILSGFSFGATIDPVNGNQGGAFAQLYTMVGMIIFVVIGGDAWTLRGLTRTFQLVPLTRAPRLGSLVAGAEQATVSVFVSAVEIAAPAILALLITDVAFGMVSKVVPQLNVFAVGFPMKVGVALLIVAASLPFLGGWLSNQAATSVGTALHSLRIV